ncbi:putative fimbrial chaperone protein [compost metagenome]
MQRLKRVIFEGIRETAADAGAGTNTRVSFGVRQNLPVIIHPTGLAKNRTPWEGLTWHLDGTTLRVENNTPYVVRLSRELQLNPGNLPAELERSYVLANEHLSIKLPSNAGTATSVRFQPATVYGYASDTYEAKIQ